MKLLLLYIVLQLQAGPVPIPRIGRTTLCWTNTERIQRKLTPLAKDPDLDAVARKYVLELANRDKLSHKAIDGSWPWNRMGYTQASEANENIGVTSGAKRNSRGQPLFTAYEFHVAYMGSKGHRENILNPHWRRIGFAYAQSKTGKLYSVVCFSKRGVRKAVQEQETVTITLGTLEED